MDKHYRIVADVDLPYGSVAKDQDGSFVSEESLLGIPTAHRPLVISTDLGNGTPFRFMSRRADRLIYLQHGTGLKLTVFKDVVDSPRPVGIFG